MASRGFQLSDFLPSRAIKGEINASARLDGLIQITQVTMDSSNIRSLFRTAINEASAAITRDLGIALESAMRSDVWSGRGGSVDIYDTGELLDSGEVSVDENGIRVYYTAPYAALVHYGGYVNPYGNVNAKVYLPPRPWVNSVLLGGGPIEAFDFRRYYQEALDRVFG